MEPYSLTALNQAGQWEAAPVEDLSLAAPLSEVLHNVSCKVLGPPELRDKVLSEDRQDVFTEDGRLKEVVVRRMVETSKVQLLAWPSDDCCPSWSREALQAARAGKCVLQQLLGDERGAPVALESEPQLAALIQNAQLQQRQLRALAVQRLSEKANAEQQEASPLRAALVMEGVQGLWELAAADAASSASASEAATSAGGAATSSGGAAVNAGVTVLSLGVLQSLVQALRRPEVTYAVHLPSACAVWHACLRSKARQQLVQAGAIEALVQVLVECARLHSIEATTDPDGAISSNSEQPDGLSVIALPGSTAAEEAQQSDEAANGGQTDAESATANAADPAGPLSHVESAVLCSLAILAVDAEARQHMLAAPGSIEALISLAARMPIESDVSLQAEATAAAAAAEAMEAVGGSGAQCNDEPAPGAIVDVGGSPQQQEAETASTQPADAATGTCNTPAAADSTQQTNAYDDAATSQSSQQLQADEQQQEQEQQPGQQEHAEVSSSGREAVTWPAVNKVAAELLCSLAVRDPAARQQLVQAGHWPALLQLLQSPDSQVSFCTLSMLAAYGRPGAEDEVALLQQLEPQLLRALFASTGQLLDSCLLAAIESASPNLSAPSDTCNAANARTTQTGRVSSSSAAGFGNGVGAGRSSSSSGAAVPASDASAMEALVLEYGSLALWTLAAASAPSQSSSTVLADMSLAGQLLLSYCQVHGSYCREPLPLLSLCGPVCTLAGCTEALQGAIDEAVEDEGRHEGMMHAMDPVLLALRAIMLLDSQQTEVIHAKLLAAGATMLLAHYTRATPAATSTHHSHEHSHEHSQYQPFDPHPAFSGAFRARMHTLGLLAPLLGLSCKPASTQAAAWQAEDAPQGNEQGAQPRSSVMGAQAQPRCSVLGEQPQLRCSVLGEQQPRPSGLSRCSAASMLGLPLEEERAMPEPMVAEAALLGTCNQVIAATCQLLAACDESLDDASLALIMNYLDNRSAFTASLNTASTSAAAARKSIAGGRNSISGSNSIETPYHMATLWCLAQHAGNRQWMLASGERWVMLLGGWMQPALHKLSRQAQARHSAVSFAGAFSGRTSGAGTCFAETGRPSVLTQIWEAQRLVRFGTQAAWLLLHEALQQALEACGVPKEVDHLYHRSRNSWWGVELSLDRPMELTPPLQRALELLVHVVRLPGNWPSVLPLRVIALKSCWCLASGHEVLHTYLLQLGITHHISAICNASFTPQQCSQDASELQQVAAAYTLFISQTKNGLEALGGMDQACALLLTLLKHASKDSSRDGVGADVALMHQALLALARLTAEAEGAAACLRSGVVPVLLHVLRLERFAYKLLVERRWQGGQAVSDLQKQRHQQQCETTCGLSACEVAAPLFAVQEPDVQAHLAASHAAAYPQTEAECWHEEEASSNDGDGQGGLLALWALLNLSKRMAARVPICQHGLYTLLHTVHHCPDSHRAAVASATLDHISEHADNASALYRAELKMKQAALLQQAGIKPAPRVRITTKDANLGLPADLFAVGATSPGAALAQSLAGGLAGGRPASPGVGAAAGVRALDAKASFLRWVTQPQQEAAAAVAAANGASGGVVTGGLGAETAAGALFSDDPFEADFVSDTVAQQQQLAQFQQARHAQGELLRGSLNSSLRGSRDHLWSTGSSTGSAGSSGSDGKGASTGSSGKNSNRPGSGAMSRAASRAGTVAGGDSNGKAGSKGSGQGTSAMDGKHAGVQSVVTGQQQRPQSAPAGAQRRPQHLKVQTAHAHTHATPSPCGAATTPSGSSRTVRFGAAGEPAASASPLANTSSRLCAPQSPSLGRPQSALATARPQSALAARPGSSCSSPTQQASTRCASPKQQQRPATSCGTHSQHPSTSCSTPTHQQPGTPSQHCQSSGNQQRPGTSCGTPSQQHRPGTACSSASRQRPQSAHVTGRRGPHDTAPHGSHGIAATASNSRPSSPWAPHVASFAQQPLAEPESHRVARQLMVAAAPDAVVRQLAEAARDLRAGRLPGTLHSLHPQQHTSAGLDPTAAKHNGFLHGKEVAGLQGDAGSQCGSPLELIGADYGSVYADQEEVEDLLVQPPHTGYGLPCHGDTTAPTYIRSLRATYSHSVLCSVRAHSRYKDDSTKPDIEVLEHIPRPLTLMSLSGSELLRATEARDAEYSRPVKVVLATDDDTHLRPRTFNFNQTPWALEGDGDAKRMRRPQMHVFEHIEGARFCDSLYGHYLLPNGKLGHLYLKQQASAKDVGEGRVVAAQAPPATPWTAAQWMPDGLPAAAAAGPAAAAGAGARSSTSTGQVPPGSAAGKTDTDDALNPVSQSLGGQTSALGGAFAALAPHMRPGRPAALFSRVWFPVPALPLAPAVWTLHWGLDAAGGKLLLPGPIRLQAVVSTWKHEETEVQAIETKARRRRASIAGGTQGGAPVQAGAGVRPATQGGALLQAGTGVRRASQGGVAVASAAAGVRAATAAAGVTAKGGR